MGSARESVPAMMPGPLHVPHFLPESTNKRERDTMQRGSYIFLAAMAGAVALMGWSGRPASADLPSSDPAVAVTKNNLPTGWDAAPVGIVPDTINEKQSVSVDAKGVWTIVAGGNDLWNNDDGGLLIYQKHTGDGSVSFHLLTQTLGDGNGWVKTAAGFRETLDSASRDVHLSYTSANLCEPAVRVNAGETPKHPSEQTGANGVGFWGAGGGARPDCGRAIGSGIWVGVDRVGDKFGYYWSDNGKIWNKVATDTIHLPAELFAGIEASKHNADPTADVNKSTLDNVNVSN